MGSTTRKTAPAGQYDYQGTPQSRMYDWLVTRKGESLELCTMGTKDEIEWEDLEYIRGLVAAANDALPAPIIELPRVEELKAIVKEAKAKSGTPDYYDQVDPQTGKKKGLPEALGPAPPPSRRHLDEDGKWVEGDKKVEEIIPTQEEDDA